MAKLNCWDCKNCGRNPGGVNVDERGVCPASIETKADRLNNGINGGRACWAIKNILCDEVIQKVFAVRLAKCLKCDFFQLVSDEEADWSYLDTKAILRKLY